MELKHEPPQKIKNKSAIYNSRNEYIKIDNREDEKRWGEK